MTVTSLAGPSHLKRRTNRDKGVSKARYEITPLSGIGDQAVMFVKKEAQPKGSSDIQLYSVKGRVRLDLVFHSFTIKPTAATINALKAIAYQATSRLP